MTRSDLQEYLSEFRVSESIIGLAVIADDPLARKVLSAWLTYPNIPPWRAPRQKRPTDRRQLWTWLWLTAWEKLDLEVFAAACGTTDDVLEQKLHMLINARLIYPDGTISKRAEQMIQAQIASVLPKPRGTK